MGHQAFSWACKVEQRVNSMLLKVCEAQRTLDGGLMEVLPSLSLSRLSIPPSLSLFLSLQLRDCLSVHVSRTESRLRQ